MPQDDIAAQWKSFDSEKRDRLLGKMTPEQKKKLRGMLEAGPSRPPAGRPIPGSPKGVAYTYRQPKEFLQQTAEQLGEAAQSEAGKGSTPDIWTGGKITGQRSYLNQAGHQILSGLAGGGEVAAKLASGLMDWRTAAGLLVSKLSPAAGAAFFATQSAKGAYDALQNGQATPENVQNFLLNLSGVAAAGAAGAGAPPESGLSKVGELRKSMADKVQSLARKVTGVEPAVKEAVTKAAEKHGTEVAETDATNRERADTLAQRKAAEADLKAKTEEYFSKEDQAKAGAKKVNDENWNKWREKVADVEVDMQPVRDTVARVEAKFPEVKEIMASTAPTPEELSVANQQFLSDRTNFMKQQGYGADYDSLSPERKSQVDGMMDRLGLKPEEGEALDVSKPMSMKQLHDLKTQIGWKVFRNEYPPNVQGAMKQVLKSLDQAEARGSVQAGALDELEAARKSHSEFQEGFGRTKPERSTVGETRKREANPEAYKEGQSQKRVQAGAKVAPDLAAGHEATAAARDKVKSFPSEKQLEPKPAPENPSVDIEKVARDAIATRSRNWGNINARDIGILSSGVIAEIVVESLRGDPVKGMIGAGSGVGAFVGGKYAFSRLLNNPRVAAWLAETPPQEVAALSKIPGADKVKIVTTLTDAAVEQAKAGKPIKLSPEARRLLGQQNVARILAASGSNIPKTPGEARDRIKPFAPQQP